MSLSLSILSLCISAVLVARIVLAVRNDCLSPNRSNLESVCRNECFQEGAVAFSVSHDDTWCQCYPDMNDLGTYIGSGDLKSGLACYSMADGGKTEFLDFGRCIIDSSTGGYGTKYTMKKCEDGGEEANQENCIFKGRENVKHVCRKECMKHDSVAFAVSAEDDNDTCLCYPQYGNDFYTGSYELNPDTRLTCYVMDGEDITYEIGFGDCVPSDIYMSRSITEHNMKICPQDGKLLRGSVSA